VSDRVLIATAWSPTKSHCFEDYQAGVVSALKSRAETELFITTSFAESKFESIVGAMSQARAYALEGGFTHYLNVEADFKLPEGALDLMLQMRKSVVLPGRGEGEGLVRMNYDTLIGSRIGWGVVLITRKVLEKAPFLFHGSFLTPDRAWFKFLLHAGIEVWQNRDLVIQPLEPAAQHPERSFAPTLASSNPDWPS